MTICNQVKQAIFVPHPIFKCTTWAVAMAMLLPLAVSNAQAATISLSGSVFSDLAMIDTTGSLVYATNIEGAAVTLNTVDFAAQSQAADGNAFFDNTGVSTVSFVSGAGSVSQALLTNGERTSSGTNPATRGIATFSGLTIGDDYLFQFMSLEDRAGTAPRELAVADSEPTLRTDYDLDQIDFSNSQGAIVTGLFTADATDQTIYMAVFDNSTSTTEVGVFVQAVQLRNVTIPEPTSLVLAVMALLGLMMTGRRRR